MQVVWEADTPDFHKRKRAARACSSCQKRKKKCRHTFQDTSGDGLEENDPHDSIGGAMGEFPAPHHTEIIRFVGDTNPESILTDISNRSKGATRPNRLGTWIEPLAGEDQEQTQATVPSDGNSTTQNTVATPADKTFQRRMNIHQERYLRDVGAFRILPRQTQDVLITLYFSCIDPVLPLFDDGMFLHQFRHGSASNLLINAICLVSCKTEDATDYLRLTEDGPVIPPFAFARTLYSGLEGAMKADLEPDRITKVQILALLSLHNDGPNGIDESSIHLTQAIHHAHTAAIQVHYSGERPEGHPRMLYWCLWSLDKINASVAGRPVTIADRDIGITRPILENEPIFQGFVMWLTISDLLAQVIAFYRPIASQDATGREEDFPTFHQLVDSHYFRTLQQSHQDGLEIFYQVVAILACRAGDATTLSYQRRATAAARIQEIVTARDTDLHIPPLPLMPYAVSLSLTVAYRLLRDSKSAGEMKSAKADLSCRCEVLEKLSTRWSSAAAMAKLGRKALNSIERPFGEDTARVTSMIEEAVAPCKPLANQIPAMGVDGKTSKQTGLDVLSSAAEAHANTNQPRRPSTSTAIDATYDPTVPNGPVHDTHLEPVLNQQISNFDDLDVLFGDFVDLAMPTLFQDPLFENQQFFDLADF